MHFDEVPEKNVHFSSSTGLLVTDGVIVADLVVIEPPYLETRGMTLMMTHESARVSSADRVPVNRVNEPTSGKNQALQEKFN